MFRALRESGEKKHFEALKLSFFKVNIHNCAYSEQIRLNILVCVSVYTKYVYPKLSQRTIHGVCQPNQLLTDSADSG